MESDQPSGRDEPGLHPAVTNNQLNHYVVGFDDINEVYGVLYQFP